MKPERILIWLFILLCSLHVSGCGQTVKLYPGPKLPDSQVATLFFPDNRANLKIDGKPIEWDHSEEGKIPEYGDDDVYVKLSPGLYDIEWDFTYTSRTLTSGLRVIEVGRLTYEGKGTLDAKPGHIYVVKYTYLPIGPATPAAVGSLVKVGDHATWIEDYKTGIVVVGTKPSWVTD